MSEQQALQRAVQSHQAGNLAQAETLYRQVLEGNPRNADALNLLGVVARQQGRFEAAVDWIQRAIAVDRKASDFHFNLGEAYRAMSKPDLAAESYRKAIALEPRDPEVHHAMGVALERMGQSAAAEQEFLEALRLQPRMMPVYDDLGACLLRQDRVEQAQVVAQKALSIDQRWPGGHFAYGLVMLKQAKWETAAKAFGAAIRLKPGWPEAHLNLAIVLEKQRQLDGAMAACKQAIALRGDFAEAFNFLGVLMDKQGKQDQAIEAYQQALRLREDLADAHGNLANTLKDRGLIDESLSHQRRAMDLAPTQASERSNYLLFLNYHPTMDAQKVFEEHQYWASRQAPAFPPLLKAANREADRPLRIGLVSPDLHEHSVAYFVEPILAAHDRKNFPIICYSEVAKPDGVTERLRNLADGWHQTTGLSDQQLFERISQDGIDILVDLAGHTAGNRLGVFIRRAAPLQVSYLGYPNTTGLPRWAMGWRLTDELADPPGASDGLHTERLWRLPGGFLCYQPRTDSPEVHGLPFDASGHITFGSFNQFSKITPPLIGLWGRILAGVAGSRLMLKAKGLTDESTRQMVRDAFAREGVEPQRLILCDMDPTATQHLGRYGQVDIALDTYPYNGTTTTCEALWMGVPVVSLAGAVHRSRVGASLLGNLGLNELLANTPEEYVRLAVDLAGDVPRLRRLRGELRGRMAGSPLTDGRAFTVKLEKAWRGMWLAWCRPDAATEHAS